jgi:hypothetical protein
MVEEALTFLSEEGTLRIPMYMTIHMAEEATRARLARLLLQGHLAMFL